MNDNDIDKMCDGCYMDMNYESCSCKNNINDEICPCSTCLVKMVCPVTCDLYREFVERCESNDKQYRHG